MARKRKRKKEGILVPRVPTLQLCTTYIDSMSIASDFAHSRSDPPPVQNARHHRCPVCNIGFKKPQHLMQHQGDKEHTLPANNSSTAATAPPPAPHVPGEVVAEASTQPQAATAATNSSYCTVCARQFTTVTGLQQHQSSNSHITRARQTAGGGAPGPAGGPSTTTILSADLGPVEQFFASYAFALDPSANYEAEFQRLCVAREWAQGGNQMSAARKALKLAQVKAFGSGRVSAVARQRGEAVRDAIRKFFEGYAEQGFVYNPDAHHRDEFKRLCRHQGWVWDESWDEERRNEVKRLRDEAKRRFNEAEVIDFGDLFGTDPNDPEAWRKLCETAGIVPIPATLELRRKVRPPALHVWLRGITY